ncbi:MAG: HpcH/HpaI aldolase/citrate lyase family protein [Sphingobium sp.]
MPDNPPAFGTKLRSRSPLVGTFVKTPTPHAIEIFGNLGYDYVVVDEEHGPFDRSTIDVLMLAARAAGIAAIVRVAGSGSILPALDMGAAGVLVPHVNSAETARRAVALSRYIGGERGCSPSPRAGRYGGISLAEHVMEADAMVSVSVMIEHPDAVASVDEIASVEGVDSLFVGLNDLAVAMGTPLANRAALQPAVDAAVAAAQRHEKAVMATAASVDAGAWLLDRGVSALVVSSDQGMMRAMASQQVQAFRQRQTASEGS